MSARSGRSVLPHADGFRPRGAVRVGRRRGRWRAAVLVLVHLLAFAHILHAQLSGRTLAPLEPSEAMQTLELGLVNAGFVLLVLAIVATLVLGRFFCGWACHVVAYQDACAWLLGRLGVRPRAVRSRLLGYLPLLLAGYMFAWPTVARWLRGEPAPGWSAHFTTDAFWRTFPGPWTALVTFLVCGGLAVYWLGAKGFCAYGCPYGALFGLSDRLASGRIRVSDACRGCGHCTAVCTSNVRVHEEVASFGMVVDSGCMKCLDCVEACPEGALSFGFGRLPRRARRAAAAFDFTWAEEVALALWAVLSLLVWRGLYGLVPLLLAGALAALSAVALVVAARLVRQSSLRLQHGLLKRDGRLTRRGTLAAVVLVALFLLQAHSAVVQVHTWLGDRAAQRLAVPDLAPAARADALAAAQRHLARADAWGLRDDPRVLQTLGLVLREQGARGEAERCLVRALAQRPGWAEAVVPLADLLVLRGARAEAEARLRALLAEQPGVVPAQQRLQRLGQPGVSGRD